MAAPAAGMRMRPHMFLTLHLRQDYCEMEANVPHRPAAGPVPDVGNRLPLMGVYLGVFVFTYRATCAPVANQTPGLDFM